MTYPPTISSCMRLVAPYHTTPYCRWGCFPTTRRDKAKAGSGRCEVYGDQNRCSCMAGGGFSRWLRPSRLEALMHSDALRSTTHRRDHDANAAKICLSQQKLFSHMLLANAGLSEKQTQEKASTDDNNRLPNCTHMLTVLCGCEDGCTVQLASSHRDRPSPWATGTVRSEAASNPARGRRESQSRRVVVPTYRLTY